MNSFIHYLDSIAKLSPASQHDLNDCIKTFHFEKSEIVLEQGQICNYLYFVEEGLLRLFYYLDGKEVTDYFASEKRIIGGIDSFFSRKASKKIIQTLEESTLSAIAFNDLEKLYDKHHDIEKVGRLLAIGAFLSMQERVFAIQFHSASQRYHDLLHQNPDILLRVPLGQIASYLGITQVSLSRIRSQK